MYRKGPLGNAAFRSPSGKSGRLGLTSRVAISAGVTSRSGPRMAASPRDITREPCRWRAGEKKLDDPRSRYIPPSAASSTRYLVGERRTRRKASLLSAG